MIMAVRLRRLAGGALRLFGGEHGADRQHAVERFDGFLGSFAQRFQTRPALRVDLDGEDDMTVARLDARHHAEADDVAAAIGIADLAQRGENPLLGDLTHSRTLSLP
jgi:hypothetical protein